MSTYEKTLITQIRSLLNNLEGAIEAGQDSDLSKYFNGDLAKYLITSEKNNLFHTHPLYEAQQEYRRKVKNGEIQQAETTNIDNSIEEKSTTDFKAAITQTKENEEMPPIWENITVRTRLNGLFEHRFTYNGKRESAYGRSKKECWENREKLIAGKKGKKAKKKVFTVSEWLKRWYEVWHLANHKGNDAYNWNITHYSEVIIKYIGKIQLSKLTGADIQEFLMKLSRGVFRKCHFILKSSLNIAFTEGIIKRNPFNSVKVKMPKKESHKALSIADQRKVFELITNEKYRIFFMYACCTGMRLQEAIHAMSHIDRENCIIYVMDEDKGTKRHKRQIPFLPELIGEKEQKLLNEISSAQAVQGYFKKLFKDNNLDYVIHSFRHTFASCCYHIGIKDKQIQAWLGHTQLATTMNVYTTLLQNDGTSPILEYLKRLKDHLKL